MNNWQRFREKLDVWIMRYSSEATAGYWGINNINQTEADHIIQGLKVREKDEAIMTFPWKP